MIELMTAQEFQDANHNKGIEEGWNEFDWMRKYAAYILEQHKGIDLPIGWNKPDKLGNIYVPEQLDTLVKNVANELRLYAAGKNEVQTVCDIVHVSQEYLIRIHKNITHKSNERRS